MPKSLDEILASPHTGRPEMTYPLCVAGKLNAEFDKIDYELDQLLNSPQKPAPDPEGESGPIPRAGQRGPLADPRVRELTQRREELRPLMAEHTVFLLLRAREDGAFRAWKAENPPKEDDRADERVGFDLDALTDDIRDNPRHWVVSINGEPYSDEQWAKIWANASDGDKWRITAAVRNLHVSGVDVPKSLSISLDTQTSSGSSS